MKILNRLNKLSVTDLQGLQAAILDEIEHRKCLSGNTTAASDAGSLLSEDGHFAAARKPASTVAKPVTPRRAA